MTLVGTFQIRVAYDSMYYSLIATAKKEKKKKKPAKIQIIPNYYLTLLIFIASHDGQK